MILFQDFDGVLNSEKFLIDWKKDNPGVDFEVFMNKYYRCGEYEGYLVPEKVDMFNKFIYSHDIQIVCSSSWRIGNDLAYMKKMYKARGLPWDRLIDLTPDLRNNHFGYWKGDYSPRNIEIYTYLKEHNLQDTVAVSLDDDYVSNYKDFPKFKPIETFFEFGVEQWHFEEIEKWMEECKNEFQ